MRRRNFRDINPRRPKISIRDHNALLDTAEGLTRRTMGVGIQQAANSTGDTLFIQPTDFWAKVTAVGTGTPVPLGWAEQFENADGTLADFTDQRTGTIAQGQTPASLPAYDLTGATHKIGDIVRLIPAKGGEYYEVLNTGASASSFADDPAIQVTYVSDVQCVGGTLTVTKQTKVFEGRKAFTVSLTGNPTGGTFTLVVDGKPTVAINWNDSAATVQADIQAVAPSENALVTGGPLPAAIQVYLTATATLTLGSNNLTGGTNPGVSISGPN